MAVSNLYILQQFPVIQGMGVMALDAAKQRFGGGASKPSDAPQLPGPAIERRLPPLPPELLRDFVRFSGGDAGPYKKQVPPHIFPQWALALSGEVMRDLGYPMMAAMNAGCRMKVNAPLPVGKPLKVRAWLESVDEKETRAIIEQRLVTGTDEEPNALETSLFVFVPLRRKGGSDAGKKKKSDAGDKPRVPIGARELTHFKLRADAGLDFARLTGDFNPVHWIPSYARAMGFRNTILHGFATFARAVEGLRKGLYSGDAQALEEIEVRFTRPLVLPAKVGVYALDGEVWVGDAPGGPAYLHGTYSARNQQWRAS